MTLRAFEENGGNPFLVMDYVDGQTLDDYLAEQCGATGTTGVSPVASGIPEADVIRILCPIAAALDYAHEQGVVHRDVKPANVLIHKDGHPFILDFGIAREVQETMTRMTGALSSGTLPYMSPEQLRGARPTVSQDVYSFAAMAYECLAGEPPFSRGQIEFQILNEKPAPLPGGTQLVVSVMSGLAKEPENRPATCTDVLGNAAQEQPRQPVVMPSPKPAQALATFEDPPLSDVAGPPSNWDVPVGEQLAIHKKTKRMCLVIQIISMTTMLFVFLYCKFAPAPLFVAFSPAFFVFCGAGVFASLLSTIPDRRASRNYTALQLFHAKNWRGALDIIKYKPRNSPLIKFFCGVCCLERLGGCAKDFSRARRLFIQSAHEGLPESFCALGYMNQHGLGRESDLIRAHRYYSVAKNLGSKLAEKLLEGLPQKL